MSNDNKVETRSELKLMNQELRLSLRKCQAMVQECREKLADVEDRGERDAGSRR